MTQEVNKIITLPLLTAYDVKIKELIGAKDSALKTELLEAIGKITSFEVKVVDVLPEVGETGYIYFVPKKDGYSSSTQNVYEEYLWIKKTPATNEAEAVFAFEKIGDTKIDIAALKSEIAADVAGTYVKSVDVTSSDSTVGAITTKTYTISYKNGNGVEIDSETISVISNVGKVVADVEGVGGHDGLMSKEDKAILDTLNADMSSFQKTADADAKYVASLDITTGEGVVSGNTTVTPVTVSAKNANGGEIDSDSFNVTTYANATQEAAGLMSDADKLKLDLMTYATEEEVLALFAAE